MDCKAKMSCYLSIFQYIKLTFTHTTAMMTKKKKHFLSDIWRTENYLFDVNTKTIENL